MQVESEHGLVHKFLLHHGFERSRDVVLRNALEAETEKAIELSSSKGQIQRAKADLGHHGKRLILHLNVTKFHTVGAKCALNWARAILDIVLPAISLERAGL